MKNGLMNSRWWQNISVLEKKKNLIQCTSFEGHVRHLWMDRTI